MCSRVGSGIQTSGVAWDKVARALASLADLLTISPSIKSVARWWTTVGPTLDRMRLLDTHTGHFAEFYDISNVRYAILSHTWDPHGEQTYQDVRKIQECHPIQGDGTSVALDPPFPDTSNQGETIPGFWMDHRLSEKIRKACEIARSHGYRYLWIDSCCIDKTSSSELSEAINSMYTWYGRAAICYAFLVDVPQDDVPDSDQSAFRKSRWFRRGWTLQELIAPRRLIFLSCDWQTLGSKSSMAGLVEEVTRIDREVLTDQLSLDQMSVARRMSWAAERETTRVEDRAYSLLGIFDLNMPTLYGEGERAFRRLQEEILRRIPDQTLFAFSHNPDWPKLPFVPGLTPGDVPLSALRAGLYTLYNDHTQSLLSSSPSSFVYAGSVDVMPEDNYRDLLGLSEIPYPDYSPSPYGLRSSFPVIPLKLCFMSEHLLSTSYSDDISNWHLVLLRCHRSSELWNLGPHLLARICRVALSSSSKVAIMTSGTTFDPIKKKLPVILFTMTTDQLKCLRQHVQVRSVHLPHPDRACPTSEFPLIFDLIRGFRPTLALSSYTSAVLRAKGYDVAYHMPSQTDGPLRTHSLVLRRHGRVLQINIDDREYGGPPLSAAAWSLADTDAERHCFPLLTCMDPTPHSSVAYSYVPDGGFPELTLSGDHFEDVVIRLELEEAPKADSPLSHYLHVDIEELGDR